MCASPFFLGLPRAQRFVATKRLNDAALDFQEHINEANAKSGSARREKLRDADAALSNLKVYLRLAHKLKWISDGQYKHVSVMVVEIGKLLGGWIKQTQSRASGAPHSSAGSWQTAAHLQLLPHLGTKTLLCTSS